MGILSDLILYVTGYIKIIKNTSKRHIFMSFFTCIFIDHVFTCLPVILRHPRSQKQVQKHVKNDDFLVKNALKNDIFSDF